MGRRDDRVDAYIANSAEFARPILAHLRELVHSACPEVEETMKWSRPHFLHHGLLCGMSAFKGHCAFGFWKGSAVVDGGDSARDGMGQFGKITALADLPSDEILIDHVCSAMKLNEEGVPSPSRSKPKAPKPEVVVPDDLSAELAKREHAQAGFEKLSPSHRREYVEWIEEAKTQPTREKRIRTTVEWLAEGKPRNWKYEKC